MPDLLAELADTFAECWKRERTHLYESYLRTVEMYDHIDEIYADAAASLGKEAEMLTDLDKKQAIVNYVLGEGEKCQAT